jgi:alkylation response protein AidB-like acyl-CoA dehydrogenase
MDFGLSDEQESLQHSVREFLRAECPPAVMRRLAAEPDATSHRLHEHMASLGWTGLIVPEQFGGLGLGLLDMALVLEEMGRAALPGPYFSSCLLAAIALRRAPLALKRRWLPALAAGRVFGTVAILEESARLDPSGITARVRPNGGAYVIDGVKLFVTDAATSDFVVGAFRSSGRGEAGVTVLLVPRDTAGLRVTPLASIDLTRRTYEVGFDHVRVPAAHRIGVEGRGWQVVQEILDAGAVGIAADSLGGATHALDLSVEYSKVRTQFGRLIGSFQAIKHMAAEMVAEIEPARALVWYAAHLLDTAPRQAPRAVAMAKARLSDVYSRVANRAVQMHGGIGFTWEHDLHFWFKRAAWNHAAFGDPAFHRERLAILAGF